MSAETTKIDALRGVAALTVLFAHADAADLVKNAWISSQAAFLGHFGVDLFFIMSGALIWRSAQGNLGEGKVGVYAINRATRILPLYWINIAFCVFALGAIGSVVQLDTSGSVILRHLTFTQSYEPNVSRALNPVLWTLAFEMTFYILVVGLFFVAKRLRPVWWLVIFSVLGVRDFGAMIWQVVPQYREWVFPFIKFAPLFMVGIILEELRAKRLKPGDAFPIAMGAAAMVWGQISRTDDHLMPVLAACSIASFYCVQVANWSRYAMMPFAWAGLISYSLYIWHYLIISIMAFHLDAIRAWIGPIFRDDLIRAVMVISFILAVSAASYLLIERPFMGPIRRWITPKPKNEAKAMAVPAE